MQKVLLKAFEDFINEREYSESEEFKTILCLSNVHYSHNFGKKYEVIGKRISSFNVIANCKEPSCTWWIDLDSRCKSAWLTMHRKQIIDSATLKNMSRSTKEIYLHSIVQVVGNYFEEDRRKDLTTIVYCLGQDLGTFTHPPPPDRSIFFYDNAFLSTDMATGECPK